MALSREKALAGRRLGAVVVDVLIAMAGLLLAVVGLTIMMARGNPDLAGVLTGIGYYGGSAWLLIYLLFRDAFSGRSLGKRMLGLQVVSVTDERPGNLIQSFARNVVLWLLALFLVGFVLEPLMALFQARGRRLGDFAAGTEVVVYE